MTQSSLKADAARAALEFVEDGMKLGIGTGSTAEEFVKVLAERVNDGLSIIGVPTSIRTGRLCTELGIRLSTLDETPELDLTVDGADEVDPQLNLIKGAGGALLREKIVAAVSKKMIVIADNSKLVSQLGAFPLPIEVNEFGLRVTTIAIERAATKLGLTGTLTLRKGEGDKPYVTDGGHLIIDASFGHIDDPMGLATELLSIPGVVEHGLFIGLASKALIAGPDGVDHINAVAS